MLRKASPSLRVCNTANSLEEIKSGLGREITLPEVPGFLQVRTLDAIRNTITTSTDMHRLYGRPFLFII